MQEIISGAVYRVFYNMNHISTSMERAATGLRWASSNFEAHDSAIAEATARSLIGSEWQGTTADAFVSAAGRSVRDCDELGDMITSISSAITDYGYALASVQGKMTNIRAQAADEGLTVSGTTISGSSGLGVWSGAQSVSEASGVDEGSGDVVGGVAESLGDAS